MALEQKHIDWLKREESKIRRDYQIDKMDDDAWERLIDWISALSAKAKGTPQERDVTDWFMAILRNYDAECRILNRKE